MLKPTLRPGLRLRAFVLALASACLFALLASTAQALPARFWGVVPQAYPSGAELQRLGDGGVESIRIPIGWTTVQPTEGQQFDWSAIDPQVAAAAKAGISVLPFVSGAPDWAVPTVSVPGTGGQATAPARLPVGGAARLGWRALLEAAVERYGPSGTFWTENPGVPERPLRNWQIWNEANFKYFVARPNPAEYGKLVKASYAAIKGVDPGARVILGGLFGEPIEATKHFKPPRAYFATTFLQQMYMSTPGVRRSFNGVSLHPYTTDYRRLKPEIKRVRAILKRNHDASKGLWVTELGWSSQQPTPNNHFAKGPSGQVTQLKGAFNMLKHFQQAWRVQAVYWFSVDDQPGSCNFCDGTGLFAKGFVPKKSWFAYVKFTGGTP